MNGYRSHKVGHLGKWLSTERLGQPLPQSEREWFVRGVFAFQDGASQRPLIRSNAAGFFKEQFAAAAFPAVAAGQIDLRAGLSAARATGPSRNCQDGVAIRTE